MMKDYRSTGRLMQLQRATEVAVNGQRTQSSVGRLLQPVKAGGKRQKSAAPGATRGVSSDRSLLADRLFNKNMKVIMQQQMQKKSKQIDNYQSQPTSLLRHNQRMAIQNISSRNQMMLASAGVGGAADAAGQEVNAAKMSAYLNEARSVGMSTSVFLKPGDPALVALPDRRLKRLIERADSQAQGRQRLQSILESGNGPDAYRVPVWDEAKSHRVSNHIKVQPQIMPKSTEALPRVRGDNEDQARFVFIFNEEAEQALQAQANKTEPEMGENESNKLKVVKKDGDENSRNATTGQHMMRILRMEQPSSNQMNIPYNQRSNFTFHFTEDRQQQTLCGLSQSTFQVPPTLGMSQAGQPGGASHGQPTLSKAEGTGGEKRGLDTLDMHRSLLDVKHSKKLHASEEADNMAMFVQKVGDQDVALRPKGLKYKTHQQSTPFEHDLRAVGATAHDGATSNSQHAAGVELSEEQLTRYKPISSVADISFQHRETPAALRTQDLDGPDSFSYAQNQYLSARPQEKHQHKPIGMRGIVIRQSTRKADQDKTAQPAGTDATMLGQSPYFGFTGRQMSAENLHQNKDGFPSSSPASTSRNPSMLMTKMNASGRISKRNLMLDQLQSQVHFQNQSSQMARGQGLSNLLNITSIKAAQQPDLMIMSHQKLSTTKPKLPTLAQSHAVQEKTPAPVEGLQSVLDVPNGCYADREAQMRQSLLEELRSLDVPIVNQGIHLDSQIQLSGSGGAAPGTFGLPSQLGQTGQFRTLASPHTLNASMDLHVMSLVGSAHLEQSTHPKDVETFAGSNFHIDMIPASQGDPPQITHLDDRLLQGKDYEDMMSQKGKLPNAHQNKLLDLTKGLAAVQARRPIGHSQKSSQRQRAQGLTSAQNQDIIHVSSALEIRSGDKRNQPASNPVNSYQQKDSSAQAKKQDNLQGQSQHAGSQGQLTDHSKDINHMGVASGATLLSRTPTGLVDEPLGSKRTANDQNNLHNESSNEQVHTAHLPSIGAHNPDEARNVSMDATDNQDGDSNSPHFIKTDRQKGKYFNIEDKIAQSIPRPPKHHHYSNSTNQRESALQKRSGNIASHSQAASSMDLVNAAAANGDLSTFLTQPQRQMRIQDSPQINLKESNLLAVEQAVDDAYNTDAALVSPWVQHLDHRFSKMASSSDISPMMTQQKMSHARLNTAGVNDDIAQVAAAAQTIQVQQEESNANSATLVKDADKRYTNTESSRDGGGLLKAMHERSTSTLKKNRRPNVRQIFMSKSLTMSDDGMHKDEGKAKIEKVIASHVQDKREETGADQELIELNQEDLQALHKQMEATGSDEVLCADIERVLREDENGNTPGIAAMSVDNLAKLKLEITKQAAAKERDIMLLRIQEEQSKHKLFNRFRGQKLVQQRQPRRTVTQQRHQNPVREMKRSKTRATTATGGFGLGVAKKRRLRITAAQQADTTDVPAEVHITNVASAKNANKQVILFQQRGGVNSQSVKQMICEIRPGAMQNREDLVRQILHENEKNCVKIVQRPQTGQGTMNKNLSPMRSYQNRSSRVGARRTRQRGVTDDTFESDINDEMSKGFMAQQAINMQLSIGPQTAEAGVSVETGGANSARRNVPPLTEPVGQPKSAGSRSPQSSRGTKIVVSRVSQAIQNNQKAVRPVKPTGAQARVPPALKQFADSNYNLLVMNNHSSASIESVSSVARAAAELPKESPTQEQLATLTKALDQFQQSQTGSFKHPVLALKPLGDTLKGKSRYSESIGSEAVRPSIDRQNSQGQMKVISDGSMPIVSNRKYASQNLWRQVDQKQFHVYKPNKSAIQQSSPSGRKRKSLDIDPHSSVGSMHERLQERLGTTGSGLGRSGSKRNSRKHESPFNEHEVGPDGKPMLTLRKEMDENEGYDEQTGQNAVQTVDEGTSPRGNRQPSYLATVASRTHMVRIQKQAQGSGPQFKQMPIRQIEFQGHNDKVVEKQMKQQILQKRLMDQRKLSGSQYSNSRKVLSSANQRPLSPHAVMLQAKSLTSLENEKPMMINAQSTQKIQHESKLLPQKDMPQLKSQKQIKLGGPGDLRDSGGATAPVTKVPISNLNEDIQFSEKNRGTTAELDNEDSHEDVYQLNRDQGVMAISSSKAAQADYITYPSVISEGCIRTSTGGLQTLSNEQPLTKSSRRSSVDGKKSNEDLLKSKSPKRNNKKTKRLSPLVPHQVRVTSANLASGVGGSNMTGVQTRAGPAVHVSKESLERKQQHREQVAIARSKAISVFEKTHLAESASNMSSAKNIKSNRSKSKRKSKETANFQMNIEVQGIPQTAQFHQLTGSSQVQTMPLHTSGTGPQNVGAYGEFGNGDNEANTLTLEAKSRTQSMNRQSFAPGERFRLENTVSKLEKQEERFVNNVQEIYHDHHGFAVQINRDNSRSALLHNGPVILTSGESNESSSTGGNNHREHMPISKCNVSLFDKSKQAGINRQSGKKRNPSQNQKRFTSCLSNFKPPDKNAAQSAGPLELSVTAIKVELHKRASDESFVVQRTVKVGDEFPRDQIENSFNNSYIAQSLSKRGQQSGLNDGLQSPFDADPLTMGLFAAQREPSTTLRQILWGGDHAFMQEHTDSDERTDEGAKMLTVTEKTLIQKTHEAANQIRIDSYCDTDLDKIPAQMPPDKSSESNSGRDMHTLNLQDRVHVSNIALQDYQLLGAVNGEMADDAILMMQGDNSLKSSLKEKSTSRFLEGPIAGDQSRMPQVIHHSSVRTELLKPSGSAHQDAMDSEQNNAKSGAISKRSSIVLSHQKVKSPASEPEKN